MFNANTGEFTDFAVTYQSHLSPTAGATQPGHFSLGLQTDDGLAAHTALNPGFAPNVTALDHGTAGGASADATQFYAAALPLPIFAAPGHSVNMADVLTADFGSNFGGYTDFYATYEGADYLSANDLAYWDLSHKTVGQFFMNGTDIGADSAHQTYVPASSMANLTLKAGNDIGALAYLMPAIAYSGGTGTEYLQYSVQTIDPSLMGPNALKGAPTPTDIVNSAMAFDAKYGDGTVLNDNDCHYIAVALAAAAGATLSDQNTQSLDPSQNQSNGFWRIAYRGSDPNPVSDWQSLVKPGDIVRMGWTAANGGGFHTTTVLSVNGDGSMQVYDNIDIVGGKNTIGIHTADYDTLSIPTTITIYRLSPDHLYLINGSDGSETLAGTLFSDQILAGAGDDTIGGFTGNDDLVGGAGNDHMDGGDGNDTLDGTGGGNDTATGDAGNDTFLFGAAFTAADVLDGGTGTDTLELDGNYSAGITLGATTMVNIEKIVLAGGNSYKLTLNDANVSNTGSLTVDGSALKGASHLTLDGSHESHGSLIEIGGKGNDSLVGGGGNDKLTGGAGADHLTPGAGNDTIVFAAASDSAGKDFDTVTGFDFSADKFDLPTTISVAHIDKAVSKGTLVNGKKFDHDLGKALGTHQLAAHDAVLFTANHGNLSGHTLLVIDANGHAGYQAGDMVIDLDGAAHLTSITIGDFI